MDFRRAVRDERDVMRSALDCYDEQLIRVAKRTRSAAVKNEALWRQHVVERLMAELDRR